MKPIPKQYKSKVEPLIHEIGQLADKLLPFIAELGDNVEIECGDCICIIKKFNNKKYEDNKQELPNK